LGLGASRARAAIEPVRSGAWELRVGEVRVPETYGGLAPKGRFVEVELLVRAAETTPERFGLLLLNNAGGDVWLETARGEAGALGANHYPEGVVTETLGQRLLAKAQGQVIAIQPDRDGAHSSLAVTIAFDAPAAARQLLLRVKDFPPVRIEIPVANSAGR
jgi:hypothetical protein